MATTHESAPHCHQMADDDLPLGCEGLRAQVNPLICFGNNKSLVVELWWGESVSQQMQTLRKSGATVATST